MSRLSVAIRRMRRKTPAPPAPGPVGLPRVPGRVQCMQLGDYRMYVDITDDLVGAVIARGGFEPHVTRAIANTLRPGDTFLDLGANIGYFSLLAASRVGPTGHVIGFEARPDNVSLARLSVRENGFRNVTLHNLAVSERDSQLRMHAPDHTSLSEVVDGSVEGTEHFVVIQAVALDDALAALPRLDVVKMDIDGGELRAVRGMRGVLRRHRPKLFFEFAPYVLRELGRCNPTLVLEEILALGYRLSGLSPEGGMIPFATASDVVTHQESLGDPKIHLDLLAACD